MAYIFVSATMCQWATHCMGWLWTPWVEADMGNPLSNQLQIKNISLQVTTRRTVIENTPGT